MAEIDIKKKVAIEEGHQLRDLIQLERNQNKEKILELNSKEQQLLTEEHDFEGRYGETQQREEDLANEYNLLKTRKEDFEDEKLKFDQEAQAVYQDSIGIKQMSEDITTFKENYENMQEELQ